jgi:hypothetical protein
VRLAITLLIAANVCALIVGALRSAVATLPFNEHWVSVRLTYTGALGTVAGVVLMLIWARAK